MKVLVTGATGYIGSHVCKMLHEHGHNVVGLDINNEQNDISKWVSHFIHGDVRNVLLMEKYDAIVHLAGVISVEESVKMPTHYYDTNLNGTLEMLYKMDEDTHFIFASTAGAFDPQSPYARSKVAAEDIIKENAEKYTIFRFFNVAGSDDVNMQYGDSTHLIRIAAECASNQRHVMYVFGNDYDTLDGTCVRDYIHVCDLASAIVYAVETGPANTPYECIGSGKGYTVNQVINTMKHVTGENFLVYDAARREGDPASLSIANQYEGLKPSYDLEDICRSAWRAELRRIGVL